MQEPARSDEAVSALAHLRDAREPAGHYWDLGKVLYCGVLLILLAAPGVTNAFWGPDWACKVGWRAALIWFFFGRTFGPGQTGCLIHVWVLAGILWQAVYFLKLLVRMHGGR